MHVWWWQAKEKTGRSKPSVETLRRTWWWWGGGGEGEWKGVGEDSVRKASMQTSRQSCPLGHQYKSARRTALALMGRQRRHHRAMSLCPS